MNAVGYARPTGSLGLKVIRGDGTVEEVALDRPAPLLPVRPLTLREIAYHGLPRRGLPDVVNQWRASNQKHLLRGLRRVAAARVFHAAHVYGQLYLRVFRADGTVEDLGLASLRVVTDAGVAAIVDAFGNTVELENFKFHGFGTGTTAEAASQTALVTEETTQYATDNTRPTGSQTENGNNVYRTVGTYSPDSGGTRAVTEHGIFTQAATGGGTMLDRSVFSAVNLVASADSLQATYDFTITSGG